LSITADVVVWRAFVHGWVGQTPVANSGENRAGQQCGLSSRGGKLGEAMLPGRKEHQEISDWYSAKNFDKKFGGMTPRDYLRDKSWDDRRRVGLDALIQHGVLKP
jgi:hypothetical protein